MSPCSSLPDSPLFFPPRFAAFAARGDRGCYNGAMDAIIRNVRDIDSSERCVLEHVLGRRLGENQQVIVQIVTLKSEPTRDEPAVGQELSATTTPGPLPEWCSVFAGLTDEQ